MESVGVCVAFSSRLGLRDDAPFTYYRDSVSGAGCCASRGSSKLDVGKLGVGGKRCSSLKPGVGGSNCGVRAKGIIRRRASGSCVVSARLYATAMSLRGASPSGPGSQRVVERSNPVHGGTPTEFDATNHLCGTQFLTMGVYVLVSSIGHHRVL